MGVWDSIGCYCFKSGSYDKLLRLNFEKWTKFDDTFVVLFDVQKLLLLIGIFGFEIVKISHLLRFSVFFGSKIFSGFYRQCFQIKYLWYKTPYTNISLYKINGEHFYAVLFSCTERMKKKNTFFVLIHHCRTNIGSLLCSEYKMTKWVQIKILVVRLYWRGNQKKKGLYWLTIVINKIDKKLYCLDDVLPILPIGAIIKPKSGTMKLCVKRKAISVADEMQF